MSDGIEMDLSSIDKRLAAVEYLLIQLLKNNSAVADSANVEKYNYNYELLQPELDAVQDLLLRAQGFSRTKTNR